MMMAEPSSRVSSVGYQRRVVMPLMSSSQSQVAPVEVSQGL